MGALHLFSALLATGRKPTTPSSPTSLFVGGLGYCGARIAASFHNAYPDCKISGTVRSSERRDALLFNPPSWLTGAVHLFDLDVEYAGLDSSGVADLMGSSHIVQTVAPIADFDRDPLLALHGNVLQSSSNLQYVGYLSSTGVYGDHGGDWVTEEGSELRCKDAKSRARVVAEKEWGKLEINSEGPRVDCFRCGGIYGPGRGPLFSPVSFLAAEAGSTDEDVGPPKYVNRILVDDICGALLAAASCERHRRAGGTAYNLVDNDPAPRKDVVCEARRLLLAAERREDRADEKSAAPKRRRAIRATGNKRCSNSRLKDDYLWAPVAPTYKEGLALLLEGSDLLL